MLEPFLELNGSCLTCSVSQSGQCLIKRERRFRADGECLQSLTSTNCTRSASNTGINTAEILERGLNRNTLTVAFSVTALLVLSV